MYTSLVSLVSYPCPLLIIDNFCVCIANFLIDISIKYITIAAYTVNIKGYVYVAGSRPAILKSLIPDEVKWFWYDDLLFNF